MPLGDPGYAVRSEPESFGSTLQLPEVLAYGVMREGAPIAITQDAVRFGDAVVARLEDGRLVVDDLHGHLLKNLLDPLKARGVELEAEAAARKGVSALSVVVFAERSTPMATIIDLMYTGGRAGFREYQFVVDVMAYGVDIRGTLTVEPPKYSVAKKKLIKRPGVRVFVEHERLRIHRDDKLVALLAFDHHKPADLDALTKLAREQAGMLKLPADQMGTIVLRAADDVSLQRALTVYSQMSGPECTPLSAFEIDRKKCFFPRHVLEAGL